jgi:ankyrin repeat protein
MSEDAMDKVWNLVSGNQGGNALGFELAQTLLECGVTVPSSDLTHAACLHTACDAVNLEMIQFWLGRGCDVDAGRPPAASDPSGAITTPLMAILSKITSSRKKLHQQYPLLAAMKLLISHGADLSRRDESGNSPLLFLCAGQVESPDALAILVMAGADMCARDYHSRTALELAIRKRHRELARILAFLGARFISEHQPPRPRGKPQMAL